MRRREPAALTAGDRRAVAALRLRAILLGSVAAFSACGPSAREVLEAELAQAVHTHPESLELGRYARFDWDRVCVFRPYTPPEQVERELGFRWSGAERTGIEYLEREVLLVFTRDQKVVQHVMFDRGLGDFAAATSNYCLPRKQAVFRADRDEARSWTKVLPLAPGISAGGAPVQDSLAVLRAIIPRALEDARFQADATRELVILRGHGFAENSGEGPPLRLIGELTDTEPLIAREEPPVCQWLAAGAPSGMALDVTGLVIRGDSATVDIVFFCAPPPEKSGRGWFGWARRYHLERRADEWVMTRHEDRWIT